MRHRLLPLLALAAAGSGGATATAAEVAGPAGVRVERPRSVVECPAGAPTITQSVSVRFTAASARRRVRSVRVVVTGTGVTKAIAARRGRARRAQVAIPCGRSFTMKFEARDARRRVIARRSFRVTSRRAAPDGAADAGDDARQTDPLASGPPPGAQSREEATGTTWTTSVDVRRTGSRAGQVCAQVNSTTADNRRTVVPIYCGKLTEDPFFVRTQEATDAAGVRRLVLGGVANRDTVASVAVNGQNLPLSPAREGMPGSGGGFIAVFDPATTRVENLTLTVTLRDGTVQEFASPSEINLRATNGSRL
jgi:hypothetical protein